MKKGYDLDKAIRRTEEILITRLIKRLRSEKSLELIKKGNFHAWELEQLNALNEFVKENRQYFTEERTEEIHTIVTNEIEKAYQNGIINEKAKVQKAIEQGYKLPAGHTDNLVGVFAGVNSRKIRALLEEVEHNIMTVEYAALRYAEDNYRRIIFDTHIYYQTGGSLSQAVDMATKDFLTNGINCVEYKNGARINIQSYTEMALRTADKRAYMQGEAEIRDQIQNHLVIVTRRGDACPRCMQYVGKVFIDDVYGSGKPDGKHPLLSTAIAGGLYHPNCRDVHTTYFEGITTKRPEPTEADLKEAKRIYELEQHQRYLERNIRKYDRLYKGAVDPANQEKYKRHREQWRHEIKRFLKENTELRRDPFRERAITLKDPDVSN